MVLLVMVVVLRVGVTEPPALDTFVLVLLTVQCWRDPLWPYLDLSLSCHTTVIHP